MKARYGLLNNKYSLSLFCLLCFSLIEFSAIVSISVGPIFGGGKVLTHLSDTSFWSVIMYKLAHYFSLIVLLHISLWLVWGLITRGTQLSKMLYTLGFVFILSGVYFLSASVYTVSAAGKNVVAIYGVSNTYIFAWSCFAMALIILMSGSGALTKKHIVEKVALVAVLACVCFLPFNALPSAKGERATQPNVIILGIDSLRHDLVQSDLFHETMPATAAQFEVGVQYTNTFTSVARTFVSWSSILTGMAPLESGIRVNLQSVSGELREQSLAYKFKNRGYKTVYATDERRFSNIEEDWGFDTVVGPKAGVADFIWGEFADIPLLNVFRLMPIAEHVFPYLAFNRAVKTTYLPDQFSRKIGDLLTNRDQSAPLFLATHLCMGHWPYVKGPATSDAEVLYPYAYPPYLNALKIADRQVADIFETLEAEGYLDNAIVMVFSDHGEGFKYDAGIEGLSKMAHGSNIFSAIQYKTPVVLNRYIDGRAVVTPAENTNLMALYDFHSLVMPSKPVNNITISAPLDVNSKVRSYIPLESGFNPIDLSEAGVNVADLVKSGIGFYDVTNNYRLEVNSEALEKIKHAKQLGVTDGRYVVGRVPQKQGGGSDWYYWDIVSSEGAKIDPEACGDFCDHVDAVHNYFGAWL